MIDSMTGMTGIAGLLGCLFCGRDRPARAATSTPALFDVAMHQLSYLGTWYLNGGDDVSRLRAQRASVASRPCRPFRTADGWIYVMCMKRQVLGGSGRARSASPELIADARFATPAARRRHRAALTAVLDDAMSEQDHGRMAGDADRPSPVAPVYDLAQAFANPFMRDRGHGQHGAASGQAGLASARQPAQDRRRSGPSRSRVLAARRRQRNAARSRRSPSRGGVSAA